MSYMIIFFIAYAFVLKRNMVQYAFENNLNTMTAVGNNLETEFVTINNVSKLILTDSIINKYLDNGYKEGVRHAQEAKSALFDLMNTFNHINSIYVFNKERGYINVSRNTVKLDSARIQEHQWYDEIVQAAGGYRIRLDGDGAFSGKEQVISFIRLMNDIETQQPKGMLIINVSKSIFTSTYKDMIGGNKSFGYAYGNKLFCGNLSIEQIGDLALEQKHYVQYKEGFIVNESVTGLYPIENMPIILIAVEKIGISKMISKEAGWIIGSILILTLIAMSMIGVFISIFITNPIEKLVATMKSFKQGKVQKVSLSVANDEIGDLKESYNGMIKEMNDLITQLINKEKFIQKAELEVLQEQIKPHFLYNTLDTIAYLALENDAIHVYQALETLGSFYRKFLSKGSREITIKGEIEIIKDYLSLQKLRYEEVFEDEYNIQDDLLDVKIPKLILQPLVENSLYHGLRPKGEKGLIKITVEKLEGQIHIKVYDSGIGIDVEQLHTIMNSKEHKSFGLKGTIERIRYYYSKEDVFKVRSQVGVFTEIEIIIPVI